MSFGAYVKTVKTREATAMVWKVCASPARFSKSIVAHPEWEVVVLDSMAMCPVVERQCQIYKGAAD